LKFDLYELQLEADVAMRELNEDIDDGRAHRVAKTPTYF